MYHHNCASQPLLSLIQGASLLFRKNLRAAAAATVAAASSLLATNCKPEPLQGNQRPWPPSVDAPELVLLGEEAGVDVTCYDPDGGQLRVYVAWGDGDTSDYGGFVYSGQSVQLDHTYRQADTFQVRAQCHDLAPLFSEWSSPRPVVVANP